MSTESPSTPPAAPQPAAKTVTFKYRIYQFENGRGEREFRAKRLGWFMPSECWVSNWERREEGFTTYSTWPTREGVMEAIRCDADQQRAGFKRLVIAEDITA